MADRAEDINEMEALDLRVDELLADVEETAGRLDAAIPSPPGEDAAFEFESADDVLGAVSRELAVAQAAPSSEMSADEVLAAVAAELAEHDQQDAEPPGEALAEQPPEQPHEQPAEQPAAAKADAGWSATSLSAPSAGSTHDFVGGRSKRVPAAAAPAVPSAPAVSVPAPAEESAPAEELADLSAAEFSSPEAITRLDEKLAATAAELSSHSGDVVDDQQTEAAMKAEEAAVPATPEPSHAPVAPVAVAAAPVPVPVAVAAVAAPAPTPTPTPAPARAAIVEDKPRSPRVGLGGAAAAAIRPLANFTMNLQPGTRQTIAYAAVVTIFQAACLWGFLAFKGPSVDIAPTSEPVILLQPGDPPAAPKKEPAKKAASTKPKDTAKADAGGQH